MKSMSINSYERCEEILINSQSALWRLELENEKAPRLYVDKAFITLFEFEENLSPEELYVHWHSKISVEYHKLIDSATAQILSGVPSEILFVWKDKDGKDRYAQCGGSVVKDFPNGHAIEGYQNDVTDTRLSKIQQLNFPNLPHILKENYYSIYSFDFITGNFQLEQSTDSFLQATKTNVPAHYSIMFSYFVNHLIAPESVEAFKEFFDVPSLKEYFKTNSEKTLVISKLVDNVYRNTEMKFYAIEYDGEDVTRSLLVVKDVDDIVIKERMNQHLLEETISRLEQAQKTLSHVIYDKMTGLYSKEYFYEKVGDLLKKEKDKEFLFLVIDIEDFKSYNSIAGVPMGDKLIRHIASFISKEFKEIPHSICTRTVGACYAVVCENNLEKIKAFQDKLMANIAEYSTDISINFVFGEYLIKDKYEDIPLIHDKAILAANSCKGIYGIHCGQYTNEMEERVNLNRLLSQDMQKGLLRKEFEIYFQPKYNVKTLEICGAEALVRWNHKHEKLLSPAVFIPLFEQNGFIRSLDYYVWEEACLFIKNNTIQIPISVNVSRSNIYSLDLQDTILKLLKKYDLAPSQLCLEFTESAYYNDIGTIQSILASLKESGVIISMDDFGSGYSSLSMLKNVSVNELKIDASFVNFVHGDERSLFILEMIVQMSKKLDLHVTVEGVETKEQLDIITMLGCDTVQGYYLSKPMPSNDFLELLNKK